MKCYEILILKIQNQRFTSTLITFVEMVYFHDVDLARTDVLSQFSTPVEFGYDGGISILRESKPAKISIISIIIKELTYSAQHQSGRRNIDMGEFVKSLTNKIHFSNILACI